MVATLLSEQRISLGQLANEQGLSMSTVRRWATRGVRGHKLECLYIGGRVYVTREAFERFIFSIND